MTSDLAICVLSAIELPLPECLAAVEAQEGGPYPIFYVRDVCPMSAAFNAMILATDARFVVQVDGDVVLKPWAVRTLYTFIQCTSMVYMAWGQLHEDGFGPGGSVRIWRRWPLELFRFRDRRCVDRDLHARIRWTGMRRLPVEAGEPFGVHYPRQTPFARFSKAKGDLQKWVKLARTDLIQKAIRESGIDGYTDAGLAMGLAGSGHGRFRRSKNIAEDAAEFAYLFGLKGVKVG